MDQANELSTEQMIHLGELSGHPGWRTFTELFEQQVAVLIDEIGGRDGLTPNEAHQIHKEIRALRRIQQNILTIPAQMAKNRDLLDPLRYKE